MIDLETAPGTRSARVMLRICRALTANDLRRRFASGTFWSMVAAVIAQGSNLIASIICARILGQGGFGAYGILQSTIGVFGVFAGMGLGLTTVKYVAQYRSTDPSRAGRVIGCTSLIAVLTGCAATLAILFFAPFLAQRTINAPGLTPDLRIASGLIIFNALNGTQVGALSGFEAFRAVARVNLITALVSFPVITTGVYLGGLRGAAWSLVLAAAAGCIVSRIALQAECRKAHVLIHVGDALRERHILWSFSIPAFVSDLVLAPAAWTVSAFLVRMPHGYEEMGVFNAANQWRAALLFIPSVVGQVLIPMTSSLRQSRNGRGIRSSVKAAIAVNGICALPLLLGLAFASGQVMNFYGPGFARHRIVLMMTAATGALMAVQGPIGNLIAGFGRMWVGALQNLAWASTLIIAAWVLLGRGWGAEGLALAYLISYVAHSTWTFWFGYRLLQQE